MGHDGALGLNGPAARAPVSPAFVPYDPADVMQPLAWRFEQCARAWPAHIALQSERPVSYAELNAAANHVAGLLLGGSIHPEAGTRTDQITPSRFIAPSSSVVQPSAP